MSGTSAQDGKTAEDKKGSAVLWTCIGLASILGLLIWAGFFWDAVAFLNDPREPKTFSGKVTDYKVEYINSGRRSGATYFFVTIDTPPPDGSTFRRELAADGYDDLRAQTRLGRRMTFSAYEDDCRYACRANKASYDDVIIFDDGTKPYRRKAWLGGAIVIASLVGLALAFRAVIRGFKNAIAGR